MLKAKKVAIIILCCIFIFLFNFPVSAATDTVNIVPTQPMADHLNGYIECFYKTDDGNLHCYVNYWRIVDLTLPNYEGYSDVVSTMQIGFSEGQLSFNYFFNGIYPTNVEIRPDYHLVVGCFNEFGGDNQIYTYDCNGLNGTDVLTGRLFFPGNRTLLSVRVYGNGVFIGDSSYSTGAIKYNVTYGSDTTIYKQLLEIEKELTSSNNLLTQIKTAITNGFSSLTTSIKGFFSSLSSDLKSNADKNAEEIKESGNDNASQIQANANQNASQIQANQDKNTQTQIQADKDAAQAEKNEAAASDGKVSDVMGAVPDTSGALPAIQNLASAMSYNGTEVGWKFPALSLPAIPGVMEEIQLTGEQPIPFEEWINLIPSDILSVVRALFDIALVLYCVYELYSLIQQVMVNKGGGGSE